MAKPRRAWIEIDGAAVPVLSFKYTDKESGEADEISFTFKGGAGDVLPAGTKLRAAIYTENWHNEGDSDSLDCGSFEVDDSSFAGPPDIVSVKAVSTPITSALRREEKCRPWEDVTLSEVGSDIASEAGIGFLYEVGEEIELDRLDQLEQSDLAFFQEICTDNGICLKVTNDTIVVFEEKMYEARATVDKFTKGDIRSSQNPHGRLLKYAFSQNTTDTASDSTVSYKDPKSGKLVDYTFEPPEPPPVGQSIEDNRRVDDLRGDVWRETAKGAGPPPRTAPFLDTPMISPMSAAVSAGTGSFTDTTGDWERIRSDVTPNAERRAMANAREKNRGEWVCSLTMVGNLKMLGGMTIDIEGFADYDGKYIIEEASHSLGGGYTTSIKAHKVLSGY